MMVGMVEVSTYLLKWEKNILGTTSKYKLKMGLLIVEGSWFILVSCLLFLGVFLVTHSLSVNVYPLIISFVQNL